MERRERRRRRRRYMVKIGDKVQWTSGGVDQFIELQEVVGFSEDGAWTFVKGSKTGLPTHELTVYNEENMGS